MRIALIIVICSFVPVIADDSVMVPGSISPDGKMALFYLHVPPKDLSGGYKMFWGKAKSHLPSSSELIPVVPSDLTAPTAMEAEVTSTLLSRIASGVEAYRQHVVWDVGFVYFISWSADSRWVSIDGGAHKFWATRIYHREKEEFKPIDIPDSKRFEKYFYDRQDALPSLIRDRIAEARLRNASPHTDVSAFVCWLDNGELAINANPYLFRGDFFFVLNARTNPATIIGFCR
jgi:hypothetical protein